MTKLNLYHVILFAMIFFAKFAHADVATRSVLGFSDWKNQTIRESYTGYVETLRALQKPDIEEQKPKLQAKADLSKKRWEKAQRLTIQDYFYLYLNVEFMGDQKSLEKAARSLSAGQMAELLVAYQGELNKSPQWNKHKSLSR